MKQIIWNESTYDKLAEGFSNGYAGYRPQVVEAPDGKTLDLQKKYLHIAHKYKMDEFQNQCFNEAFEIAQNNVSIILDPKACALRILEYKPGVNGAGHTDFDLLTINLWRSHLDRMVCLTSEGLVHWGELAEDFLGKKPDYHEVLAHPDEIQKSIVFFALPSHQELLQNGETVGQWLERRISKARYTI